jgi:hypothetical protein
MLRAWIFAAAMCMTACLGAATGDLAHSAKSRPAAPSQLDYLILASMADSQHLLSIAAYQPSP